MLSWRAPAELEFEVYVFTLVLVGPLPVHPYLVKEIHAGCPDRILNPPQYEYYSTKVGKFKPLRDHSVYLMDQGVRSFANPARKRIVLFLKLYVIASYIKGGKDRGLILREAFGSIHYLAELSIQVLFYGMDQLKIAVAADGVFMTEYLDLYGLHVSRFLHRSPPEPGLQQISF